MYEPGSDGILWWGDATDEARHRSTGSLLDRCRPSETCPKVVEIFGSAEFYNLRASPNLVGTGANRDIPLPSNVRRYYLPGVSHANGRGGFDASPRPIACSELPLNSNPEGDTLRALLVALTDWVVKGTPPPPSQYPRLDRGELVPPRRVAMGFPVIPGVPFPDGLLNPLYDYDFGPRFHYADLSGVITRQPAPIRQILPMLVPRVDADGNEVGGVGSVLHQAPLGTYTGWNIVAKGFYKDTADSQEGSFIPFVKTKAEREASADPRLSLEERYGTHEKYVAAVRAAAAKMVRERFLLQEDADRLIAEADRSNILQGK